MLRRPSTDRPVADWTRATMMGAGAHSGRVAAPARRVARYAGAARGPIARRVSGPRRAGRRPESLPSLDGARPMSPTPVSDPGSLGFDADRLDRAFRLLDQWTRAGELPAAAVCVG